jgi:hypothetical protein
MSFGRFIYFCAAWGAVAAFLGWAVGRALPVGTEILKAGVQGMCLGAYVGAGLAVLEAAGAGGGARRLEHLAARAGTALTVGATGGWVGGVFGQFLYSSWSGFFVLGWALTGLLIGAAPAAFDVLAAWIKGVDAGGAVRKVRNGFIGGVAGGLLGGMVAFALVSAGPLFFPHKPPNDLWTPTATGFVALGACIGLAVGLAQVILKEAWLRVDAGFRTGRELILSRPETTIGRAESCDLGLFGDPGVERVHARILRQHNRFVLVDGGSAGGTYVNDERVAVPTPLSSGDRIRVGTSLLTFGERANRAPR